MGLPDALNERCTRRSALAALGLLALAPRARAHSNAGPVSPPAAPPATRLTLDDGSATRLSAYLRGHVTAVQMVFTRCRATCPIQGALFGGVQRELGDALPEARLLSISIDPENDAPDVLESWLARYQARARWRAARPDAKDLSPLLDFLKARASGADRHTAQIYFFDRTGKLTMRSVDFPPASDVVKGLATLVEAR